MKLTSFDLRFSWLNI